MLILIIRSPLGVDPNTIRSLPEEEEEEDDKEEGLITLGSTPKRDLIRSRYSHCTLVSTCNVSILMLLGLLWVLILVYRSLAFVRFGCLASGFRV